MLQQDKIKSLNISLDIKTARADDLQDQLTPYLLRDSDSEKDLKQENEKLLSKVAANEAKIVELNTAIIQLNKVIADYE